MRPPGCARVSGCKPTLPRPPDRSIFPPEKTASGEGGTRSPLAAPPRSGDGPSVSRLLVVDRDPVLAGRPVVAVDPGVEHAHVPELTGDLLVLGPPPLARGEERPRAVVELEVAVVAQLLQPDSEE